MLEFLNLKRPKRQVLVKIWYNWNAHTLLVELQSGAGTGKQFVSVLKIEMYSYYMTQQFYSYGFT